MTRIITYIILVILVLWLFDTITKAIKGYFKFQADKAADQMKQPQKITRKRKVARILAIFLMILGATGFFSSLFFYFTGNPLIPFKKSIIVSVVIFLLSYIWYSDRLQPGK
jgi:hypothetical protein